MNNHNTAVHRTIVVVDVEGFGDRRRTNQNQLAIRAGLYSVMYEAFRLAGISLTDHYYEDRGDGIFILVGPEVPKGVFVELLPYALVNALETHNNAHQDVERIRLRMAINSGEVNYDEYGVTSSSINFTFRLLASEPLRRGLSKSTSVLAVITSTGFFDEVVRHSAVPVASYHPVQISVKETETFGWMYLVDYEDRSVQLTQDIPAAETLPEDPSPKMQTRAIECLKALMRYYRAALKMPIAPVEIMPTGLKMPTLQEGYIDHRIRAAEYTSASDPGRESWWVDIPVYEQACRFLTDALASGAALKAPLILLGHPGSGKSILTRILACELSAPDFLPVRIELRKVVVEAGLQNIIEHAIRDTTGESMEWPQLVEAAQRSRPEVVPVVILDGFDELLQTTGVVHYDFLTKVQEFQKREQTLNRPLAVIVTSRIAVTERAIIPYGATVVRLEPFSGSQIRDWLDKWVRPNKAALFRDGLTPLPAEVVLNYEELAEQPLLLLMLAIYDADDNILQRRASELGQTELYVNLLKDFASREVNRRSSNLSPSEFMREIENELFRLSIAAFSMFNRRSQWVQEADLDADLSVLLYGGVNFSSSAGESARLTDAQLTFGRFFFIHESRAIHGGSELHTYEFLHSTFGEFLVAQLVVRILDEIVSSGNVSAQSTGVGSEDMLYALLSYSALTSRRPIVTFINDLINQFDEERRAKTKGLLLRMHARADFPRAASDYDSYEPIILRATERYAAWSVNLVVLAVLVGRKITASHLYPEARDAVNEWRKEVMIWRSQLSGYGWEELHALIALERLWDEQQRREMSLRLNDGTFNAGYPDIFWMYNLPAHGSDRDESFVDGRHNSYILLRKINFICNMSEDILTHGLEPVISLFPTVANVSVVIDDRTVSAAHAFIAALYAPYGDGARREVAFLDLARVAVKLFVTPDMDRDASYLSAALALLVPAAEKGIASPGVLEPFRRIRESLTFPDSKIAELIVRLDDLLSRSKLSAPTSPDD
jgi:hypothetical protein